MSSDNLRRLASAGQLKAEPPSRREFMALVGSGRRRLADARTAGLALESRFDLAYNAAHALSLAALRWHGYRSENRYLVFQYLSHTLAIPSEEWRVLALCHDRRNAFEYSGEFLVDETLTEELVKITQKVLEKALALPDPVR